MLISSSPVSAGELDKHLPADTTAYASWAGRGLVFDGSMFGQMIQDPEVQEILKLVYEMIDKNIRTNNEFYVAPVFNEAIQDDKKIKTFDVDKMWGLGTPEDLCHFLINY